MAQKKKRKSGETRDETPEANRSKSKNNKARRRMDHRNGKKKRVERNL